MEIYKSIYEIKNEQINQINIFGKVFVKKNKIKIG